MSRLIIFFLISILVLGGCASKKLCDHIELQEGRLSLNENERILVCGSDKSAEGWKDVPIPQARYQLNVILQNKGYLNAKFERQGETLKVWPGDRRKISSLEVTGGGGLVKPEKKRKVVGEALEPEKLDEISDWVKLVLRSRGYACPQVNLNAQAWDGLVRVDIEQGARQKVSRIEVVGLEGLDEDVLARFRAFHDGDFYDVRETQLTTSRMMDQGLFQSAYFVTQCKGDEVDLKLMTAVGKPRIFRFGLGASTEEFPFADVWFKNTKLDNMASNLTANAHVSNILQSLEAGSELYILPYTKRTYFGPRFKVSRESERAFEVLYAKAGADIGRTWDWGNARYKGRAGPTLNYTDTMRGEGPSGAKYLSWEGSLSTMNHVYEVFTRDQREGWIGTFDYRGQREGLGSEINVDQYKLSIKYLWNIGGYFPPLFVLATRAAATAVDSKQDLEGENRERLPLDYRIFLGGDQSLRGFARQSLDNGGRGYLTALEGGFELRLIEEVPYKLEPFILWDVARVGDSRYTLKKPIFTSYGGGLRWASPFGTLRGSLAKGRIYRGNDTTDSYRQETVGFLSFGREF